jgi:hypothetical protein
VIAICVCFYDFDRMEVLRCLVHMLTIFTYTEQLGVRKLSVCHNFHMDCFGIEPRP